MLKYDLNLEFQNKMKLNQLIVDSYEVDADKQKVTIEIKDIISNKYLRVVFNNASVVEESFDILNQPVKELMLSSYKRFYKSAYFEGAMMVITNQSNPQQEFAIVGG